MYNNMLQGVKQRILKEVEGAFLDHPAFSGKVKVFNKFPYEQRIQFGAILRNSSASQIRLAADNYLCDLHSHVRLCKEDNFPGIAIEWVRENVNDITKPVMAEDLSSQADPTNRLFHTSRQICTGQNETAYCNDTDQIAVTVNGNPVNVDSVRGREKEVILSHCPPAGAAVLISYWARTLAEPGLYNIDFVTDHSFIVHPFYSYTGEVLFAKTTGLESTVTPAHKVYESGGKGSDGLFLRYPKDVAKSHHGTKDLEIPLVRDIDYSINYSTSLITFLQPLPVGYALTMDYRSLGPDSPIFDFQDYQEIHDAIPGVVLCVGRRAKADDRQLVVVSEQQESQAAIYGGHWEMSLSFGVISKDPIQMAEMADQVVNHLWGVRKNTLEFEGITLNRVEPTGESEETFIESTGDLYYESTVDINLQSEWQRFVPHKITIKHIGIGFNPVVDVRPVIRHPSFGFERVI